MSVRILIGDVRDRLRDLPDESVHCVVTSPPYWGLRDYGTASWEGGDTECDHRKGPLASPKSTLQGYTGDHVKLAVGGMPFKEVCGKCGARRIDRQLGMEPTLGEHIETMVSVFREVRRVLRKDGTVWLNYGDCYFGSWGNYAPTGSGGQRAKSTPRWDRPAYEDISRRPPQTYGDATLKPKDLCMIPNRLAIALQEPYHLGPIKNEIDRAWLAGLIDADGCIGIRRENNGKWNPSYIPYLTVGCSDRLLVERCAEITGLGKVNIKSRAGDSDKRGIKQRRDGYVWRLDGQIASRVIRDIYPYLVQKQPQALVCNAMNVSQEGGRPTRSKPVPTDIVAYRQRLYEAIKSLNQRRAVDLPDLPSVKSNVEQGWWVRSEIVWHKPNPMPESVTDRPATAHEKIWLLTKSARYWYDAEAVRTASNWDPSNTKMPDGWDTGPGAHGSVHRNGREKGARKTDKQRGHGRRHAGFNDRWDAMSKSEQQANGANLRNVWTVPTKGFSEAHFATFPPDLIVPCIKAGTSEKGCCAECGAPWVRETEARLVPTAKAAKRGIIDARDYAADKNDGGANRQKDGHIPGWRRDDITLGWSPSCKCHVMKGPISQTVGTPPDPVACTVMDPFGGSGTTGLVADRLGRNAILIELNPEYAEMAQRRITDDAGMFHTVEIEQRAEAAE